MTLPCKDCITLSICRAISNKCLQEEIDRVNEFQIEENRKLFKSWKALIQCNIKFYNMFFDYMSYYYANKCSLVRDYLHHSKSANELRDKENELYKYVVCTQTDLYDDE